MSKDSTRKGEPAAFAENLRIDVKLIPPDDSHHFNSVNYKTLVQVAQGNVSATDDAPDYHDKVIIYKEESYIDNTQAYPDSFPWGQEPERDGFFVNQGLLKLKCVPGETTKEKTKKRSPLGTRKKTDAKKFDGENSKGKSRIPSKMVVAKKRAPCKNDNDAKLDNILMALLKERMETQDSSSGHSKKAIGNGQMSSKDELKFPGAKKRNVFLPRPRMKLSFVKMGSEL